MANLTIPIRPNLTSAPLDLGVFVSRIVGLALIVAAIAAFLYLVLAGILWITAGGDKGKIEEARNRITGSLIGLAIVAAAWAVFLLVDHFLGLGVAGGTTSSSNSDFSYTTQGTCLYPISRCCDDVGNSSCFCQNPNYRSTTYGSCNAGSGQTGVSCGCIPR